MIVKLLCAEYESNYSNLSVSVEVHIHPYVHSYRRHANNHFFILRGLKRVYTVNLCYNGLMGGSVIFDFRYKQVKGYVRTGYIARSCINIKTLLLRKGFYIGVLFMLNNFLTTKPSQCVNICINSHLYTAILCSLYSGPL
jgi:hypothetical protein